MSRVVFAVVAFICCQQVAIFRTTTSKVAVNVSVYSGSKPVAGLSREDFSLTDNGVVQKIESAEAASVPVDLSLVVDVSGSTSEQLLAYRRDVTEIAQLLRSTDQLRLIAFETGVRELLHLTSPADVARTRALDSGRTSSVYDGIASALLRQPKSGRRQVILVYTDGVENRSVVNGEQLLAIAKTSEGVVHFVTPRRLPFIVETDKPCRLGYGSEINAAPAAACIGPSVLEQVASLTGGSTHLGSELSGPFKRLLSEYFNSYILYFDPEGVSSSGWHALEVRVVRGGKYRVEARRGYFRSD